MQDGEQTRLKRALVIKTGSPVAALIGRWGAATALVIGAVLLGRIIRDMPYLLPNRLPGLVLYEMGPGLLLALAICTALALTRGHFGEATRLAVFALIAVVASSIVIGKTFAVSLGGQWL